VIRLWQGTCVDCKGIRTVVQTISENGIHVEEVYRMLSDKCGCRPRSRPYHECREALVDDGVMVTFDERPER